MNDPEYSHHDLLNQSLNTEDDQMLSVIPVSKEDFRDACSDISATQLPETLDELEIEIDRLKQQWNEFTYLIGQRLKVINDRRLYTQKGYNDFGTYVRIALKMSENNAYYYIAVFDFFTEEQTRIAGSKLKLIIPVLNRVKRDKTISEEIRLEKIKNLTQELYHKIYNKTYREADKIIQDIRRIYFSDLSQKPQFVRYIIKKDKIIINEDDKTIQDELIRLIKQFYGDPS